MPAEDGTSASSYESASSYDSESYLDYLDNSIKENPNKEDTTEKNAPNKLARNGFDKVTPRNKKNSKEEKLQSKKKTRYGHLLSCVLVLLTIFGLKTHIYFWWTRGNS